MSKTIQRGWCVHVKSTDRYFGSREASFFYLKRRAQERADLENRVHNNDNYEVVKVKLVTVDESNEG